MDDVINKQMSIDAIRKIDGIATLPDGDTVIRKSAVEYVLSNMPSAQHETHEERTETHACDCIDRQAAIDIERNATVDTNPSHFEAHQKFTQFMDDAEISSFGRWQWSNGFNTALTAVGIDLKKLPSAQPDLSEYSDKLWRNAYERGKAEAHAEIVRCKDCKNFRRWIDTDITFCDLTEDRVCKDDFCSFAERRTDEQTVSE